MPFLKRNLSDDLQAVYGASVVWSSQPPVIDGTIFYEALPAGKEDTELFFIDTRAYRLTVEQALKIIDTQLGLDKS